jgi:glutamine synthetase
MDTHGDLRARMVVALEEMGIDCEFHHHEVGSAGQAEINVRFDTLLRIADQTQLQKYVIKNVAREAGKSATFMPKPLYEENGSGMHVHQSLSRGGHNLCTTSTVSPSSRARRSTTWAAYSCTRPP